MKYLKAAGSVLLLIILALTSGRATAQDFGLAISNSPGPYFTGNTLTYTIFVTNVFGPTGANELVTNQFSSAVQLIGSSNSFFNPGTASNVGGAYLFQLGTGFNPPSFAVLTLQVTATNAGPLTNIVSVGPQNIVSNSLFVTNVIVVSNQTATLNAFTSFPTAAVLAGDYVTYTVTVTNPGANSATGVVLSNIVPAGVNLISVMPTNPPFVTTNGAMVFSLGTLTSKSANTFAITVQPTNVGTNIFLDTVSSSRSFPATVTNTIVVNAFDTTQLVAVNSSAMTYNPQTGLMQQTIQLSNIGTNTVAAARVIVLGLTNILYNAVGTNSGNPFVQYAASLAPGQSVNLLLEYFVPTRQAINVPNSAYTAVPAPAANLTPPSGTPFNITLITNLPSGNVMIEFPSTLGKSYTIVYSDNPGMTNLMQAQPPVVAPADRVQWIDDGPPKTVSVPTNTTSRFYQVIQNP